MSLEFIILDTNNSTTTSASITKDDSKGNLNVKVYNYKCSDGAEVNLMPGPNVSTVGVANKIIISMNNYS